MATIRVCIIESRDGSPASVFEMGSAEEEQHERAYLNHAQFDERNNIRSWKFRDVESESLIGRAARRDHVVRIPEDAHDSLFLSDEEYESR